MAAPATSTGIIGVKHATPGSPLKKHFSAAQVRALLTELKLRIQDGDSDDDIQEKLGVSVARYNELKRELYRQENHALLAKTAEDVYLEYSWAQQKVITDLKELMGEIPENQPNAKVGALKAISDIHDKILKVGQDIGVINKEPEKKLVIHGHAIAKMSNGDLRKLIAQETMALAGAIAKYGDTDMEGNPVAHDNGPTFSEQMREGMQLAGPTKAAAARNSRQAVKRTKVIDVDPG